MIFNNLEKVRRAMNCFNKLAMKVEETDEDIYTNQVGKIIEIEGWICLIPMEVEEEYKVIGGTRKRKVIKWDIERVVFDSGNYDNPPDSYNEEVVQGLTLFDACSKAWEMIVKNALDMEFENMYYDEQTDIEEMESL